MAKTISLVVKKLLRWVFIIVSTLTIIACAALLMAPRLFNADAFKHHIETILMTHLQRVVQIQDVSISFMPNIHLRLTGITLGNAKGFGISPQFQVKSAGIFLEIWPLIDQKFVIKRMIFDNISLTLTRLSNGQNNWEDLLNVKPPHQPSDQSKPSFTFSGSNNISVNNAEIELDDQLKKFHVKLSQLDYQCTGFLRNIVHLGFDMTATVPMKNGSWYIENHTELDGGASLSFKQNRYTINDAHIQMKTAGLLPDDQFFESHLDSTIALSYDHGAIELTNLQLQLYDILLKGNIYVRNVFDIPSISGHLTTDSQNLFPLSFISEAIGFNGPVNAEMIFQTRGNTLASVLKHSRGEVHIQTGAGNIVLPDHLLTSDSFILKPLKQANISIYLKPVQSSYSYGFQPHIKGVIKQLDSLLDLKVDTRAHIFLDSAWSDICIKKGVFDIQATWKKLSDSAYSIKGNITGNVKTRELMLENVSIKGPLINGRLDTTITTHNKKPTIDSHVSIKIDQVRNVFQAFSIPMPRFHDPTACKNIAFDGDIILTNNHMDLKNMTFMLDDSEIMGQMMYQYDPSTLNYHLTASHLNLDRQWMYWSKMHSGTDSSNKETMRVNGNIKFYDLRIYNLTIDDMHIKYSAKDSVYRFSPMSGSMYGGKFSGHWTFDYQPRIPKVSLLLHCKDIQVEQYLKDYYQFDQVIGQLHMTASLSWDFKNRRMIRSSINGNAKLELSNAAINGILIVPTDVQKQILENYHQQPALDLPKKQYLDTITGHVKFRNGTMQNSNLIAYAKGLRIKGKGSLNIVKQEVDYLFYVGIKPFPIIPYHVQGSIWNAKTSLDTSEFLKVAVSDFFKQAGKLGQNTLKDTLDISGRAFDVNTEPIKDTVDKSSATIKKTITKSSGTIRETLTVGGDILRAGKHAIQSLGSRLKGLFIREEKQSQTN
ncbi:MAG: hypothetical protein OMM_04116 [Candidatus Magnetoglobus multicellularis str. Araruama]|uniref:AsmA domain-containing protein n=1 Tax=Candidatus Magnetoglobus multicellularis str. Araruama TaxID=890399 RepID=A0A1V1P2W6_9BACT|nr:MAG: hypothetical protein OMM_04116 [Candidatus Magnetoglobus multicellularis str. Araruama]